MSAQNQAPNHIFQRCERCRFQNWYWRIYVLHKGRKTQWIRHTPCKKRLKKSYKKLAGESVRRYSGKNCLPKYIRWNLGTHPPLEFLLNKVESGKFLTLLTTNKTQIFSHKLWQTLKLAILKTCKFWSALGIQQKIFVPSGQDFSRNRGTYRECMHNKQLLILSVAEN